MKALITGISGQDGYWLSQLLIEKGYEVHGIVRRNSQKSLGNLEKLPNDIAKRIKIYWGDITDTRFINELIKKEQFDEIYHLAAQSFVSYSFENPRYTYDVNIGGTLNIADAVFMHSDRSKVYFAATSEMFGKVQATPQNEKTPFYPQSPYGVSKLAGFWTMKHYREAYGLFMSNGILFNHESEVRGEEFVTSKICKGVNQWMRDKTILELGNLSAKRDWGHAKDYVKGMWLMLQHNEADDFVLATGENHTVQEFVERAFFYFNKKVQWFGVGKDQYGKVDGELAIKVNPEFFRPLDVETLLGDSSKAQKILKWKTDISFDELVRIMTKNYVEN